MATRKPFGVPQKTWVDELIRNAVRQANVAGAVDKLNRQIHEGSQSLTHPLDVEDVLVRWRLRKGA